MKDIFYVPPEDSVPEYLVDYWVQTGVMRPIFEHLRAVEEAKSLTSNDNPGAEPHTRHTAYDTRLEAII